VIISALRETNAKNYSEAVIWRLEESFSPAAVLELMRRRLVFAAVLNERVVGTASLDGPVIRTVFVMPACEGRGIGRKLMAEVAQAAMKRGLTALSVPSSVTAESFYAKLGFSAVRDSCHGEERTILMERSLARDP
jgi:N-acetylglutamate synthase-like GNAT family acetyltransferase